jgi:hypothetical protein
MAHQSKSGRRVKGRNCELFPKGGAMSIDKALTEKLKKNGDYGKRRWNAPGYLRNGGRIALARMSPREKRERSRKLSRKYWDNVTSEQRKNHVDRLHKGRDVSWSKVPMSERRKRSAKMNRAKKLRQAASRIMPDKDKVTC